MDNESPVYVNWGRMVADCSRPGCTDAREVDAGQKRIECANGHVSELGWDPRLPQIVTALDERLSDKRRNWFPRGHPLAMVGGLPHGQSPDDLRAETAAGEESDARMVAECRAALVAQMREFGLSVDEAGNVLGRI
jgi:hypothetical protein